MAKNDNEHRMVFDIRGKRRHVVKFVYAILAVLMGLSLFLVTGAVNLGTLFGSGSESTSGAKIYEEQAQRIEAKLVKDPEDPELLLALTRAQLNAGNQSAEQTAQGTLITTDSVKQYRLASDSWSQYLQATDEPSPSGAQLVAPVFVTLAEGSKTGSEYEENMKAAAEAARIVAEKRPSINSLSTLSYYEYFHFDEAAAEKARREAVALTKGKFERENLENQLDTYKKRAKEVEKTITELNKAQESAQKAGEAQAESEGKKVNPFGGLGGAVPSE